MTKNLDEKGFNSIVNDYDLFFIDIWGVIHNGIKLFDEAINALDHLNKLNKNYILLTNAPRPNSTVIKFLENLGLKEEHRKKVYTSGQAALSFLEENLNDSKFYHIGPPKDFDLFKRFQKNKVDKIIDSNLIICTGFFENIGEDLNFYKNLLNDKTNLKMICTNPDLVVDKGNSRELCAGTIAKLFEEIGGSVNYFGKPFPLVYNKAFATKDEKVLCIGDNLNTDIRGANNLNYSSMLITSGIHKFEIEENLDNLLIKHEVKVNFTQSNLKW